MTPEVVFLKHEDLREVDEGSSEELGHPLAQIKQENFVDCVCTARLDHQFESFLGQIDNFLECLVELDLCELVGTLDHCHRFLGPLLVNQRLASDLVFTVLTHPGYIFVPFLAGVEGVSRREKCNLTLLSV